MKRWLTLFVAFSLSTASGDCADAFASGVKLFGAKQYTAASASFAQAVKANPGNDQAYYYQALSAQYSKETARWLEWGFLVRASCTAGSTPLITRKVSSVLEDVELAGGAGAKSVS